MTRPSRSTRSTRRSVRTVIGAGLAAAALALAGACTVTADPGSQDQQSDCGPDQDYLIGMSQANNAEPYREVMNSDITTAAAEVPGFVTDVSEF